LRFIRPWPSEKILEYASGKKGIIVFDRAISMGAYGPLFTDTAATLYDKRISLMGVIAGLTGVDVKAEDFAWAVMKFVEENEEHGYVFNPRFWLLPRKFRENPDHIREVARIWS
jgi:pyruvate ferredoxin oxidoreductase alpha subunit